MSIGLATVFAAGLALIATGLFYQLRHKKMRSDPILITACYIWGAFNITTAFVSGGDSLTFDNLSYQMENTVADLSYDYPLIASLNIFDPSERVQAPSSPLGAQIAAIKH